jgi:hypothetical protein
LVVKVMAFWSQLSWRVGRQADGALAVLIVTHWPRFGGMS